MEPNHDRELDQRKQRILQAIVQDYVATAEPVGSQVLVERYVLGVKSATIRNEMAEMSERGYLRQPHTSAGRIPSNLGYRFFVSRLMILPVVDEAETVRIERAISSAASELEAILRRTCLLLAKMTRLPAVAVPPSADDTELRQVFLSAAGADKALLVFLLSTGHTEHRILVDTHITASDALLLANALNDRLNGTSLATLRSLSEEGGAGTLDLPPELHTLANVWHRVISEAISLAHSLVQDAPIYVEGTESVLEQPEFRDVDRLSQFLTLIQHRAAVLDALGRAMHTIEVVPPPRTVQVVIGEETVHPQMSEYSLVSSTYYVGIRERGTIGVLGPTRMDYARATAAVELMARTMSDILTRLSFAS
ncbi:MAG: heat-inducible transcriptional repressor HrcA [Armatimonadaceae bacterium]